MNYLELSLKTEPDFAEILMVELAEIGFESFTENENGLEAYIQEEIFEEISTKKLLEDYAARTPLSYAIRKIEKQNWNAEWENNYQPITIGDQILVRATFHKPQPNFPYEIVITPKMSFGTGHHETTSMVLELQLGIDHKNKKVLDIGCGTGILAIMAAKLGASEIAAFDIDEWSAENSRENIELNFTPKIVVRQGTIQQEPPEKYDILLANINRNILLEQIPIYKTFLKKGGYLLVSGFYEHDAEDIIAAAAKVGLKKIKQISKNQWAAVVLK